MEKLTKLCIFYMQELYARESKKGRKARPYEITEDILFGTLESVEDP